MDFLTVFSINLTGRFLAPILLIFMNFNKTDYTTKRLQLTTYG